MSLYNLFCLTAPLAGLEPATFSLGRNRSIQLSYRGNNAHNSITVSYHTKTLKFLNIEYSILTVTKPTRRKGGGNMSDKSAQDTVLAWNEQDGVKILDNQVPFFPISTLVMPLEHPPYNGYFSSAQMELWSNLANQGRAARDHAIREIDNLQQVMPEQAPQGFRIICNFEPGGGQSQTHAHLQVHAGRMLDKSRFAPNGEPWVDAAINACAPVIFETQNTRIYDVRTVFEQGHERLKRAFAQAGVDMPKLESMPPLTILAVPQTMQTQYDLWEHVGTVGADATEYAHARSNGYGFRVIANFPGQQRAQGWGSAHILIVGGTPLSLSKDYA